MSKSASSLVPSNWNLTKDGVPHPAIRITGTAAVLAVAWLMAAGQDTGMANAIYITVAALVGAYMAMNIGANDVANNFGPAVGARAVTLTGALLLAGVCEAAGALIAGGSVVNTISKGIIDPSTVTEPQTFIWAMLAALLAAAIWVNVATALNAPVSTTHAVVGGVLGAGIAAVGFSSVQWPVMGTIAASWVISPVLGGLIAAAFLWGIEHTILRCDDMLAAARAWVPVFVAVMVAVFIAYLGIKGLQRVWSAPPLLLTTISLAAAAATYAWMRRILVPATARLENRADAISGLFVVPLVFAAGLLSFAHGANDVANAIGPLAAIVAAVETTSVMTQVGVPEWILVLGGIGIAAGLGLFGHRLIRTVGKQITKLNPIRAYCVALSAGITVLIATQLGLPVSSTHIAIGGVFGVGFLREYFANKRLERLAIASDKKRQSLAAVAAMDALRDVPGEEHDPSVATDLFGAPSLDERSRKKLKKKRKRKLVRRSQMLTIAAAWIITVPCAAAMSAALYFMLRGALLP